MPDDVVITGMGVVSPIGVGESEFWDALYGGKSGAAPINCLDTADLPRKVGCQVKEHRDLEFEARSPTGGAQRRIGRAARLAIAAARQAIHSSNLTADGIESLGPRRISIIVGTTMGETEFIENRLAVDPKDWLSHEHVGEILSGHPGSIAEHVADCVAGGCASEFSRQSPNHPIAESRNGWRNDVASTLDLYGACAAGNMAIAAARTHLLDGRCDVALAGGADGFSRLAFIGFMRLRVMAAEVCRPFDVERDGLFVGEGAAIFVLERESSARARGAPIRARIVGTGNASENYHPTRPHPDGDGLSRAVGTALHDAALSPTEIDYVCAHGTGTPQNDAIEVNVMNRLFAAGTPFSSIKALTGHTMGAAAAIEAAACVLMLEKQTLIPTWNLANVLQPCAPEAVAGAPRSARLRCAINNSAGFGGYNSSIILAGA